MKNPIIVKTMVNAPKEKTWEFWNNPKHISNWALAANDWRAKAETNDVRIGGRFKIVMYTIDNSASFDFTGTYTQVIENQLIEYDIDDGRHVKVEFNPTANGTEVIESFEPENENPKEMQRSGWQAILDTFNKYVSQSPDN